MVGKALRSDDSAEVGELPEKGIRMRDRRDRNKVGALQYAERQSLSGSSASQLARREMRSCDGHLRRRVGQGASHILYRRSVRSLAGNDHQIGAPRRPKWLAPRPRGQQPRGSRPGVGVDEDDVGVSRRSPMLKRIVEHDHIDSLSNSFAYSANTVSSSDDWNTCVQSLMHNCLVAAVSAQDDSRFQAFRRKSFRTPRRDRCLAGTPDGEISDAQDRD